jgi:DnaJ-class molecular chaperone
MLGPRAPTAVVNSRQAADPDRVTARGYGQSPREQNRSSTMLVLVIVIIAVGYVVSVRIHPLRKCPRCNMSGRHFGAVFKGSYRRCRRCDGRGQLDRVGTQVFYGGTKHTGVFPKK